MDFGTVVIVLLALAFTGLLLFAWIRRARLPKDTSEAEALSSQKLEPREKHEVKPLLEKPSAQETPPSVERNGNKSPTDQKGTVPRADLPSKTSTKREISTPPTASEEQGSAKESKEERDDAVELKESVKAAEEEKQPVSLIPERSPEEIQREKIASLKEGLRSTRSGFVSRLARVFQGRKQVDASLLEEIEEVLITADIGVLTVEKFLNRLKNQMEIGELTDEDSIWKSIRSQALEILTSVEANVASDSSPSVILVVGVNGVGKTTTIGKLASLYQNQGKKVLLAAGDTFRAAAVLQLEVWGRRVGCSVVKGKDNADPSSVVFEAIKKAKNEGFDLVIADTAGRLHTKVPLMDELKKVCRTVSKALDGREVDEVLLVLDSTIGQNAIQQVQIFKEALAVTGIALTKLDGTAKGGVILGIVDEHQIPMQYIGLGEKVEDLREFDAESFVDALFSRSNDSTMVA